MNPMPVDADALEILTFLMSRRTPSDRTTEKVKEACHMTAPRQAYDHLTRLCKLGLLNRVDGHYDVTTYGKKVVKDAQQTAASGMGDQSKIVIQGDILNSSVSVTGQHTGMTTASLPVVPGDMRRAGDTGDDLRVDVRAPALGTGDAIKPRAPKVDLEADPTLDLTTHAMPAYTIHPMRFTDTSFDQNEYLKQHPDTAVRFVLTFEDYPAALPLPVIDNDRVGRERTNDVWVRYDSSISREHCVFFVKRTAGGYQLYVRDLNSKNGTWVNGERVQPGAMVPLTHGTRLKIGTTSMVVTQIAEPTPLLSDALRTVPGRQTRGTTVDVHSPQLGAGAKPRPNGSLAD